MKTVIKLILILGLLLGVLYLFNDQRRKIGAAKDDTRDKKSRGHSIEELQQKRNRIIRNINDER